MTDPRWQRAAAKAREETDAAAVVMLYVTERGAVGYAAVGANETIDRVAQEAAQDAFDYGRTLSPVAARVVAQRGSGRL